MTNEKRLIDAKKLFNDLADYWGIPKDWDGQIDQLCEDALCSIENAPTVEAVEVVRCAYCDPGSRDYNPCWLCKKGGTAHDVEHCHVTNYGDYEPMQPHCHLCGRKL